MKVILETDELTELDI